MNRKINLITRETDNIEGLENISLDKIGEIFPYSCELLICKYFNIFPEDKSFDALLSMLEKIRPNGQLIIGVIDLASVAEDLISKKLTTTDFFAYIRYCQNPIGVDDIIKYVNNNNNYTILEIVNNQQYIHFITLTKKT